LLRKSLLNDIFVIALTFANGLGSEVNRKTADLARRQKMAASPAALLAEMLQLMQEMLTNPPPPRMQQILARIQEITSKIAQM
jgi:hypothetical protein